MRARTSGSLGEPGCRKDGQSSVLGAAASTKAQLCSSGTGPAAALSPRRLLYAGASNISLVQGLAHAHASRPSSPPVPSADHASGALRGASPRQAAPILAPQSPCLHRHTLRQVSPHPQTHSACAGGSCTQEAEGTGHSQGRRTSFTTYFKAPASV